MIAQASGLHVLVLGQAFEGMQYIPLIILSLLIGVCAGVVAILLALLRRRPADRTLARYCVIHGVLSTAIFWFLIGSNLIATAYLFIAFPAALGLIAGGVSYAYRNQPPARETQFSLIVLFYLVTVAACIGGVWRATHAPYFGERDRYLSNFERMPGIQDVVVEGMDHEGTYFSRSVRFSLAGREDAVVVLGIQRHFSDCKSQSPQDYLHIEQLGPWTFHADWSTIEDDVSRINKGWSTAISLGPEGEYRDLVPIRIHSIQDVIDNYDELVAFFESWPTQANPGRLEVVRNSRGTIYSYYGKFDPKFRQFKPKTASSKGQVPSKK